MARGTWHAGRWVMPGKAAADRRPHTAGAMCQPSRRGQPASFRNRPRWLRGRPGTAAHRLFRASKRAAAGRQPAARRAVPSRCSCRNGRTAFKSSSRSRRAATHRGLGAFPHAAAPPPPGCSLASRRLLSYSQSRFLGCGSPCRLAAPYWPAHAALPRPGGCCDASATRAATNEPHLPPHASTKGALQTHAIIVVEIVGRGERSPSGG